MLHSGVGFLHDDARQCTVSELQNFNWEVFGHSPYSPDLEPSDYHLFMYMKNGLHCSAFMMAKSCSPAL